MDQVKDAATFGQLEKYFMGISELHAVPAESELQAVTTEEE
jgi:ABC-2 type transport system ATP-binding protein